jgi:hypothetical protein
MGTARVLLVVVMPEVIVCACTNGYNVTANEREIISRVFVPIFPAGFSFFRNSSRF